MVSGMPRPMPAGVLGHIAAQGDGQLPGLDVLHGDGPVLGAGHRLLRDEQDVPRLHLVLGVLEDHILHLIGLGNQVRLYRDALVLHTVHGAHQLLAGFALYTVSSLIGIVSSQRLAALSIK